MGYNITRSKVKEYQSVLETIVMALSNDEPAVFECPPEEISRERYRLREALKSAEVFTDMYDGRYAHLSESTVVTMAQTRNKIIVKPKSQLKRTIAPPDERQAIAELENVSGTLHVIEIYPSPSFNEEYFVKIAEKRGWKIHLAGKVNDGGKLSYPAERITPSSDGPGGNEGGGFSAIFSDDPPTGDE